MSCRVACQREPEPMPHHVVLAPGLPPGFGVCPICKWLVSVEDWAADAPCPGPVVIQQTAAGCPVVLPMAARPDPDGERLTDRSPVGVAPSRADAADAERERMVAQIQRCARHQL